MSYGLSTGYVEVLVIPAGARRIKVVEEKPAHSYLGNWHCRLRNLVGANAQLWDSVTGGSRFVSKFTLELPGKHLF